MSVLCQFLAWDSEFFGVRIARVHANRLTPESAQEIDAWCAAERIACLYFLADRNDSVTTRLAEDHGYRFVDLRLTLDTGLDVNFQPKTYREVRPFQPDDLPSLTVIARVSYTDSRYYFDPCFPRDKCDLLYQTWIQRSTDGSGFADVVLVAEVNGLPVGYISCKCHETMGQIGLVGVAESARGRSIGQALVNGALAWFAGRGMTRAEVVTQGRNIPAQRLYQRCGFLTADLSLWYHKWYGECNFA